jgi:hypothetical protein
MVRRQFLAKILKSYFSTSFIFNKYLKNYFGSSAFTKSDQNYVLYVLEFLQKFFIILVFHRNPNSQWYFGNFTLKVVYEKFQNQKYVLNPFLRLIPVVFYPDWVSSLLERPIPSTVYDRNFRYPDENNLTTTQISSKLNIMFCNSCYSLFKAIYV